MSHHYLVTALKCFNHTKSQFQGKNLVFPVKKLSVKWEVKNKHSLTRSGHSQEVPNIMVWLGNFWYFVAEEGWWLTRGGCNGRFNCTDWSKIWEVQQPNFKAEHWFLMYLREIQVPPTWKCFRLTIDIFQMSCYFCAKLNSRIRFNLLVWHLKPLSLASWIKFSTTIGLGLTSHKPDNFFRVKWDTCNFFGICI